MENSSYAKGEGGIFMTILKETGGNIVLLRTALGMTQEEAAFRSNLSVSRYQDIERGCANTTADSLIRIAQTFQVDPRLLGIFTRENSELIFQIRNSVPDLLAGELPVYDAIVFLRRQKRLTQAQLARRSNISLARLRDIEHGCANVTVQTLARLANGLDISLPGLILVTMTEREIWENLSYIRNIAGIQVS